jgi:hypothetical protein
MPRLPLLLFAMLLFPNLKASLLSVEATATLPPGNPGPVTDSQTVTATFSVLITGGTGDAWFTPEISLNGVYNPIGQAIGAVGVVASTTWPFYHQVGDPLGLASTDTGHVSCGFTISTSCAVPFTFGVPEDFTITLAANVIIAPGPTVPPGLYQSTVIASASFDGIYATFLRTAAPWDAPYCFEGGNGYQLACPLQGNVSLANITSPEPRTWALMLIGLATIGLLRARKGMATLQHCVIR